MKDGSDERGAHAAGVEEVGKPAVLHWEKNSDGTHSLLSDAGGKPVATVSKYDGTQGGQYQADLHQTFNGSGASDKWSVHASVQGAKNRVERIIGRSWDAPVIRK